MFFVLGASVGTVDCGEGFGAGSCARKRCAKNKLSKGRHRSQRRIGPPNRERGTETDLFTSVDPEASGVCRGGAALAQFGADELQGFAGWADAAIVRIGGALMKAER